MTGSHALVIGTPITPSSHTVVDPKVWNRQANAAGWNAYLAGRAGADDVEPYAAPARATDLAGLPPTYIDVGDLDLFLDEDIAYAQTLMRAGAERVGVVDVPAYPAPPAGPDPGHAAPVVPLRLATSDGRELAFLSTTTLFGTPGDVTVAELAIEAFLPADDLTAAALRPATA